MDERKSILIQSISPKMCLRVMSMLRGSPAWTNTDTFEAYKALIGSVFKPESESQLSGTEFRQCIVSMEAQQLTQQNQALQQQLQDGHLNLPEPVPTWKPHKLEEARRKMERPCDGPWRCHEDHAVASTTLDDEVSSDAETVIWDDDFDKRCYEVISNSSRWGRPGHKKKERSCRGPKKKIATVGNDGAGSSGGAEGEDLFVAEDSDA